MAHVEVGPADDFRCARGAVPFRHGRGSEGDPAAKPSDLAAAMGLNYVVSDGNYVVSDGPEVSQATKITRSMFAAIPDATLKKLGRPCKVTGPERSTPGREEGLKAAIAWHKAGTGRSEAAQP